MSAPPSYFAHEPKIRSEGEMFAKLKERSIPRLTLQWLPAVKATQRTECGKYELLGCRDAKGVITYHARCLTYPRPKPIGHNADPQLARTICEAHWLGQT